MARNDHPLALNDAPSTINVTLGLSDLLVQCQSRPLGDELGFASSRELIRAPAVVLLRRPPA
jgi:hypothetical protein